MVFPLDEGPEMPTITAFSGSGGPGVVILWGPEKVSAEESSMEGLC